MRGSDHVSPRDQHSPAPDAYPTRPQLVKNSQIKSSSLHNPLPLYLHTYIWPFLAAWPAFLAIYLSEERYTRYINGAEWTFVWAGSIFSLQALTWLTTKWNVNISAFFTSTSTNDVQSAQLIKIVPVTNAGAAEICPLIRDRVCTAQGGVRYLLTIITGRRQAEYLVPVPKKTVPLRPRREQLRASLLRYRRGAQTSTQNFLRIPRPDLTRPDRSYPSALW